MNLILIRKEKNNHGIFGSLIDLSGKVIALTLEHAYPEPDGSFEAKIPLGIFTCVRGLHRLKNMNQKFDTFEVTGVPGHSNLLFHAGNFNCDSEGCILLGRSIVSHNMITDSRITFDRFMDLQKNINSFQLTVQGGTQDGMAIK
jgi:hypothetical protein